MANILDLSNSSTQTATFSVQRDAVFDNTVDFYQVNADGSVIDPDSGETIVPGEEGYAEAAIANRLELNLSVANGETASFEAELAGGALYAPIIAANGDFSSFSDGDSSNDPNVYFTYEAANIDGFDHVDTSGENQFSFEDLLNGGDEDFNDLIVNVELDETPNPNPNPDGIIEGENLVIDDTGVVASVDLSTGEFTEILDTDIVLTDIDVAPDNSVFAINFSDLYSIDLEAETATLIGEHGINGLNALEIAEDGTLYAAASSSQEIYTLDPTTGTSTTIGSVPFDFSSAGDLQFIENTLYATDTQNLVALDVEGNVLNEATSIGSLGLDDESVFGITIDEDGDPVGLTNNGSILSFDLATGSATSIGIVENNTPINGAAAVPDGFFDGATPPSSNGTISGTKFEDRNGNGERDNIVEGENPDVVFVIDASPSAVFPFVGDALQDVNNDADASAEVVQRYLNDKIQNVTEEDKNTLINATPNNPNILDAQLTAFIALNQQLEKELGNDTDVGIVVFSGNAASVDLDPSTAGFQLTTAPNADNNNNGTPDVEEVLRSITFDSVVDSSGTDFEAALQETENIFNSLGTQSGEGNLVFLSDGFPAESGSYVDEVARLNDLEVNVTAFGVGESASLEDLRSIDSGADIFTSIDEVTDIFGELNSGGNEETESGELENPLEPGVPDVSIYLDLNNNGTLDEGEPSQVTDANGQYVFEGLAAGSYTVREVVSEGFTQTLPVDGQYTFELGEGEIAENIDFGNVEEIAMMEVEATEI